MTFKTGVRFTGLRPATCLAMGIVDRCFQEIGVELVITSVNDGTHEAGSLHYQGYAFDCRTEPAVAGTTRPGVVPPDKKPALVETMRARLGENFQVVVEADHIHVEASPILAPGTT